jgi:hypothetical protein
MYFNLRFDINFNQLSAQREICMYVEILDNIMFWFSLVLYFD